MLFVIPPKNAVAVLTLACMCLMVGCADASEEAAERPNVIFILADDLGYGELGVYGQEQIETPHLDALAARGMRFTQHYTGAPVCAPARGVLLTGQHTGHAFIRGNDEWNARGDVWDYAAVYDDPGLEGQRPLPDSILTIAELLQESGYATGMVGKWGLGAPGSEGVPNRQGFDFFYGYNCQRQAHTYYPMHLWHNEARVLLDNAMVPPHTPLAEGADPHDPASYARFSLNDYAPTLMHEQALRFLEDHHDRPFFLYYASPIPHLPLQAPERWVEHYEAKFGPEEPYTGDNYYPNRTPRATYAAMISYLDEQVGDLVAKLDELGLTDNTLILFTSDNGPTYTGGADTPFFDSARPFKTEYGWGKGFLHEGGIRVPMIATWPGQVAAGSQSDHVSAFYDLFPTLADLAGIEALPAHDGISFLPALRGEAQPAHDFLYWEFPSYNGQQAVRMGKWKGLRKDLFDGNLTTALYDLEADPREQHDVAAAHPEIVAQIEAIMVQEHIPAVSERFKIKQLGDE